MSAESIVATIYAVCEREMRTKSEEVRATMQTLAPVETGDLRASIMVTPISRLSYFIGTDVPYAKYQEYGNGHGRIRPKNGKRLAITVGKGRSGQGRVVAYVNSVSTIRNPSRFVSKTAAKFK